MENQVKKTRLEERLEEAAAFEAAQEATAAEAPGEEDEAEVLEPVIEEEHAEEEMAEMETVEDDGAEAEQALTTLSSELEEARDQVLRLRAEFDNYRKRTAREAERVRKTAAEALIRELLPVVDNLERAYAHVENKEDGLAQGVEMVLKQLCEVLSAHGAEPIPALGEVFDPKVHEALSHLPSEEYGADVVMTEYERGYRMGDFVLRPAKVVVSSGPPAGEQAENAGAGEA